jgi:flagellar motility protein MotE (MotC chaperone)
MKNISYKILFLCVLLPPVCYVLTVQSLEGYLKKREIATVDALLIQHPDALYEGQYPVREEINRNLSRYLKNSIKTRLGVETTILVKTRDGQILYPPVFGDQVTDRDENPLKSLNYVEVAADNYRVLNDGLMVDVGLKIRYNSLLSGSILIFYILLAGIAVRFVIRRGLAATQRKEEEQRERIEKLSSQLSRTRGQLEEVIAKEKTYLGKIGELNKEKRDLSKDVDGLLEEMEELESGLKHQRANREELENEVENLRSELDRLKQKGEKRGKKKRASESIAKRLKLLYKNLEFSERAITGFAGLTPEFQLKGEEVIHQLNENDELISIRRKVFGKGGKMNVLEVDFAYSGRLYFQKNAQSKIHVLAIGTKNSQNQDLAYIGKWCE